MRMAVGLKFYEESTQFRPTEPAAGKAWWREGMEATLRQTHDTHKQHHDGGKLYVARRKPSRGHQNE